MAAGPLAMDVDVVEVAVAATSAISSAQFEGSSDIIWTLCWKIDV